MTSINSSDVKGLAASMTEPTVPENDVAVMIDQAKASLDPK